MKVEQRINSEQVADLVDGRAEKRIQAGSSEAIRDGLALLQLHHKRNVVRRGAGRSPAIGGVWTHRTGELSKSFHIEMQRGAMEGAYGSDLHRARILELGGTVNAKSGKFLAIPLDKARYGVGKGLGPRAYPDLFVVKSKKGGGTLLLARKRDKRGKSLDFLFVLKKSVKLPPRPTLGRAVSEKSADIDRHMLAAVVRATERHDGPR